MAGDFNKPVVTDPYVDTLAALRNIIADVARGLDPALLLGTANAPVNTIRWNSANSRDEIFTGSTWVEKCALYNIDIAGNSATATDATNAGTADALNNGNNYSVHSAITFNNGGVGNGYMVSNEPTWGFLHRPSVNGTSAAHTWTDAAGAVIAYLKSNGALTLNTAINVGGAAGGVAGSMGYDSTARGLYLWGKAGATNDFEILNAAGTTVARIPTGTTNLFVTGAIGSKSYPATAYSNLFSDSLPICYNALGASGSPSGADGYFSGFNSTLNIDGTNGWQMMGDSWTGQPAAIYIRKKNSGVYGAWTRMLDAAYVAANGIAGNATTATTLSGDQSNWATKRTYAVTNMLGWKNFGNNHVIFDASNSTSPSGSAVNNANSNSPWAATYPTLMGWNGTYTYGVRVDSCRQADVITPPVAGAYWFPSATIQYGSNSSVSPVKVREYRIGRAGVYRVHMKNYSSSPAWAYSQIYKNGSAIGVLRTSVNNTGGIGSWEEDFTFAAGDLVQIYVWTGSSSYPAYAGAAIGEGAPIQLIQTL